MSRGLKLVDLIKDKHGLFPRKTYEGLWHAQVKDKGDPEDRMRLRVFIPGIHEDNAPTSSLPWAEACSLLAGKNKAAVKRPKIGEWVWVGFEQGDPNYPVWMGSWWGIQNNQSELPEVLRGDSSDHYVIQTDGGHIIDVSDEVGKVYISIKSKAGNEIKIDDTGKEITINASQTLANIVIKPSAVGKISMGNQPITPCNDLPNCLYTGAPHAVGTGTIPGNQIMIP